MTNEIFFSKHKKAFDEELRTNNYKTLYIALILCIVFHWFFILFDYYLLPKLWIHFLKIRLCVGGLIFISIIIISFKHLKRYITEAIFFAISIIEIAICYMLPHSGEEIVPYTLGLTICIFLSGIFLKNLRYAIFFNIIVSTACFIAFVIWPYNIDIKILITILCVIVTAILTSLFSAYYLEVNRKKEFIARKSLEKAKKELESLDEMKNNFIANITHEFRSPLTVVISAAELNMNSDNNIISMKLIYEAGLKLKNNIDKLLDIARIDAKGLKLTISNINPVSILHQIYDFYSSSLLNSNIDMQLQLPDYVIDNFYTDSVKFEEIINNIISNAIKFVDHLHGIIKLSLLNKEKSILITVEDNGIGISSDKIESIFNRFEQAEGGRNSKYRGSGIGLSYAKQLVELLQGRIWAKSEGQDKGSTFYIELPKGNEKYHNNEMYELIDNKDNTDTAEQTILKQADENLRILLQSEIEKKYDSEEIYVSLHKINKNDEYDSKKGIILIIDDDKLIREVIVKYLQNDGYKNFILAPNGKLGLDAVYQYSPAIIISDYNMPVLRGDQFHDIILTNPKFKNIPFVFLTAVLDKQIMLERTKKGISAYIEKPIDKKHFLVTIDNLLKKHYEYLKVYHQASIDELSGLKNRRELFKALSHELAVRKYQHLTLIFLDIDYFKKYNDTYGHISGDYIIKNLGNVIQSTIRNYDIAGRYGGDEFLIILPDTNIEQAEHVVDTIRTKIKSGVKLQNDEDVTITLSFGLASLIDNQDYILKKLKIKDIKDIYEVKDKESADWQLIEQYKTKIAELLLDMADKALYESKFTICNKCNFKSDKSNDFNNNQCPRCSSKDLNHGRDKVSIFNG